MTNFPIWAQTNEAQRLLTSIAKNKPPVCRYHDGLSLYSGRRYEGVRADALRAIFNPFYGNLMDWVEAARTETRPFRPQPDLYHQRREAVVRYESEHGVDAVIANLLGEAK